MRRMGVLVVLGLLGAAGVARGGTVPAGCCKDSCKPVRPPPCPDCSCPCDHCLQFCTLFGPEYAHGLIDKLHSPNSCVRLKAVKMLGCRLYANYCTEPEVLDALVGALVGDSCWEVRRAAAWAILTQKGRTETGVLALYVSSKMDPHYMVRSRAAEALDILTLCRDRDYKQLYRSADVLIGQLRALDYKPGTADCHTQLASACADCGLAPLVTAAPTLPALPGPALRLGPAVLPDVGPGGGPELLRPPTPAPVKR
jgi:hypothetical protein